MLDRSLKALSLILSYPSQELQDAMPEIGAILGADPRIAAVAGAKAGHHDASGFADAAEIVLRMNR